MKRFSQIIISCLFLFFVYHISFSTTDKVFAEEIGFRFPTTCTTNGSSCDNMKFEDSSYSSWPMGTLSEDILATFTDFGIPLDSVIDNIQIKLRIRTSTSGWSWFPYWSDDGGNSNYPSISCYLTPDSCHYNTTTFFNSIASYTMTWLNNNPEHIVTGKDH